MANKIPRVVVREQDPKLRAANFEEVCYGYNQEEALLEATRCLNCKNPRCVAACPVNINIPEFIHHLTERNFQNRMVGFMENGSWAPVAAKTMQKMLEGSKNLLVAEPIVTVQSALSDASRSHIDALAHTLCP
mgnify:CR=1 FL=1